MPEDLWHGNCVTSNFSMSRRQISAVAVKSQNPPPEHIHDMICSCGSFPHCGALDIPAAVTQEALDAFWEAVGKHYPTATTGDLSPERTVSLDNAAEQAVLEWVANNVGRAVNTNA